MHTVANFSTAAEKVEICQRPGSCKNPNGRIIGHGDERHYVVHASLGTTVVICLFCKAYTDQQASTRRVETVPTPTTRERQRVAPLPSPGVTQRNLTVLYEVDPDDIRASTNSSQRGELHRTPVAALPGSLTPRRAIQYHHAPLLSPHVTTPLAGQTAIDGLSPQQGYSAAHLNYPAAQARARRIRLASTSLEKEVCTVSYTVECQHEGRKSSRIIFNIPIDGIPAVPAHITGSTLKELILAQMAHNWAKHTHGYPLDAGAFTLRDPKSSVDLGTSHEDSPAIYDQCVTKSGTKKGRFAMGKTIKVVLLLDSFEYDKVEAHIQDNPDNTLHTPARSRTHIPATPVNEQHDVQRSVFTQSVPSRKRARSYSQSSDEGSQTQHRLNQRTRTGSPKPTTSHRSRSMATRPQAGTLAVPSSRLDQALRTHGKAVKAKVDGSKSYTVQYFAIPNLDYEDLADAVPISELLDDISLVKAGILSYNSTSTKSQLGSGRFKICLLGQLSLGSSPWTGANKEQLVALKRPYQIHPTDPKRRSRLPSIQLEIKSLVMEGTTLQWASSLLKKTLDYVEEHERRHDEECPPIPSMRFVHFGMAKCLTSGTDQSLDGAFLVEEVIPKSMEFTRLLGNGSALPCTFSAPDARTNVAQFCAFAQHVQWTFTNGRAFCADWQGGVDLQTGESLLTDPQIMTHPDLGLLFAEGNISETFMNFKDQHRCDTNPYCKFFEPTPVELPALIYASSP